MLIDVFHSFQPIGPGEELLVWYNGEDNPEIAAALEEERTSSSIKKNSPRARRGKLFTPDVGYVRICTFLIGGNWDQLGLRVVLEYS